jgi:hypothetical protein
VGYFESKEQKQMKFPPELEQLGLDKRTLQGLGFTTQSLKDLVKLLTPEPSAGIVPPQSFQSPEIQAGNKG